MSGIHSKADRFAAFGHRRYKLAFSQKGLAAGLVATVVAGGLGASLLASIGVGVFAYSFIWYVDALGNELAIIPIISLIASAQWLLGPFIWYATDAQHLKYTMYVDEHKYFSFALPGTIGLVLGMKAASQSVSLKVISKHINRYSNINKNSIYLLFFIGMTSDMVSIYVPNSLKFVLFLSSQFIFIATIYLLIIKDRYRWAAFFISFLIILISSSEVGAFHLLLLWSALMVSFVFFELRLRFLSKFLLILGAVFLMMQLQIVKSDYRQMIRQDTNQAGVIALALAIISSSFGDAASDANKTGNQDLIVTRLNQGWIISAVMNYVPRSSPFQNGKTLVDAIGDSFSIRLLSDKRKVNVSDAFQKYTGLSVMSSTSLGISLLGEAWVNFGYYGILLMLIFGLGYGFLLRGAVKVSVIYPTFVLWAPLLFLQAIKAETELVVELNHVIKAGGLIIFTYFVFYKLFRRRI